MAAAVQFSYSLSDDLAATTRSKIRVRARIFQFCRIQNVFLYCETVSWKWSFVVCFFCLFFFFVVVVLFSLSRYNVTRSKRLCKRQAQRYNVILSKRLCKRQAQRKKERKIYIYSMWISFVFVLVCLCFGTLTKQILRVTLTLWVVFEAHFVGSCDRFFKGLLWSRLKVTDT